MTHEIIKDLKFDSDYCKLIDDLRGAKWADEEIDDLLDSVVGIKCGRAVRDFYNKMLQDHVKDCIPLKNMDYYMNLSVK